MTNLLENIPDELPEELIETLVSGSNVRIERIVSRGHVTPEGEWYDQEENEFVSLIQGEAEITFEDGRSNRMKAGDWLLIPAHDRHRVTMTSKQPEAVWLCVFYSP